MLPDAIAVLKELKLALDAVGVEYMVVGSLASSVHGLPRATRDADMVLFMDAQHIKTIVAKLQPRFYISEEAALAAIEHGTSFNAIHEDTFYQADLFVLQPTPYNRIQISRRVLVEIEPDTGLSVPFQSAEDTVLSKLSWFRQGGNVSEVQWKDAMDVIRAQGAQLDLAYLRQWAANLEVDDLLQSALDQAWTQPARPETEL
jgi:hypothetical protein